MTGQIRRAYHSTTMTFIVSVYSDAATFLDEAGDWLSEREAENCLAIGIPATVRAMPEAFGAVPPWFAIVRARGGGIVACAFRTPPWRLGMSDVGDPAALPRLADAAAETYPDLSSFQGPVPHVNTFADLMTARVGRAFHVAHSERIFRLTAVRPPRPVPGSLRRATASDRGIVIDWWRAFWAETTGGHGQPLENVETTVDSRIAGEAGRRIYLWDDGGPVSLAGLAGPTPHGIRVGPVYTPPELRNRGYASACVAAVSQAALDEGRAFCFLFTDLANPTSNHIYQEVGYRPVRDVDVYESD
jgi:predicted GNAT family acetyltransferase